MNWTRLSFTDTGQILDPVISASGWETRNVVETFYHTEKKINTDARD